MTAVRKFFRGEWNKRIGYSFLAAAMCCQGYYVKTGTGHATAMFLMLCGLFFYHTRKAQED